MKHRHCWRFFNFGAILEAVRNNVLATLAYYDVLDFPLRAEEVLRYLVRIRDVIVSDEVSLPNVRKILDQLILDKIIDRDGPYYFLHGRDYLVPLRLKREKISRKKWRKALSAIRWLKFIPYVEAVFASGSLALNNCDELSDLDVLVVTRKGRIWLTRFFITVWLSIIGARRKPFDKIAPDKICLNHYITGQSLRIPFESLYNAQTYVNLKPMLVRDKSIINRFQEENGWIKKYILGQWQITNDNQRIVKLGFFSTLVSRIRRLILDTKFGDWFETRAKSYQVKRISRNPLTHAATGHVIYSDDQLAFHPDSPEEELLNRYNRLLTSVEIKR